MAQYGLDVDSREHIGSRWSQQWSRSDKTNNNTRKILYLCSCGYDHRQRNTKYDHGENPTGVPGTQQRHTGAPFTACLAHAEITVRADNILRVRGHFNHNEACKTALFENIPPIPVHPSVYTVALAQLRDGAAFSDIRRKNRELFQAKAYKDFPRDISSSQFRWLLTHNDSRSLYRQYNRMKGVTVTDAPQVNVDEWLDPKSDKYNPTLAHAIFHYAARASKDERFEVAIATDDMNRAAWRYGHDSQIILDGTFGVCDSRLLLFIVMAVDENRKGVPVAFLLFSAPGGNKQTSSGYDTKILTKLLGKWSESLNKCGHLYGFPGVIFRPLSAITDTDLKERGALIIIFPDIWLLICRFHLRQSWRNHRNKHLKGKSPVMLDLKHRMGSLETALVATQTIAAARELLEAERQVMVKLAVTHKRAARKATKHINYLDTYWTTENLWKSWSDYGRTVLSSLLNRAGEGVIPTTNHLESFNRVLKRVHLRRFQNGGRRLRLDILIHALVIYILPSIFEERRLVSEQSSRVAGLIRLLPGGALLLEQKDRSKAVPVVPKIAYLVPDADRDLRATELLENRQISTPVMLPGNVGLTLTCYSARALSVDTNPTTYDIRLGFNGVVSCKCEDFLGRGGACKHIRGALLMLDDIRRQGINIPQIPIPRSLVDAQTLQAQTVLTITIPATKDLPTSRAAEKVEDVLQEDDTCFEDDSDAEDEDGDDDTNVPTDASSESESESDNSDEDDSRRSAKRSAGPMVSSRI
ncbi:hypothetical protein C8R46DRAFT_998727 [Mycena filopes]|nr:hypothetical protein C8R46DRAFT_998727 [Mycena filopes]